MRQDHIPRGRTIPMGAVPVLARGLGHMVPTYLRRRPGSPSNGFLGSALRLSGSTIMRRHDAPIPPARRACAARRWRVAARLDAASARGAFRARLAARGRSRWRAALAPASSRPFIPIRDEPDTLPLLAALAARASPPRCRSPSSRAAPLTFRRWRPGEPTVPRRDEHPRARCRGAPRSSPICCSCRSPPSTGAAIASASAPAITTARWRGCAPSGPIRAVGVAYARLRGRRVARRAARRARSISS